MEDSILTSVKKMLGITAEYEHFDADIIMHINSAFMVLHQLGLGPANEPFAINDDTATWSQFINRTLEDKDASINFNINSVKSYMFLKVKRLFDPPSSAGVIEAIDKQIAEFEWRLNVEVDPR